jgi:N-methylhydantoinase A
LVSDQTAMFAVDVGGTFTDVVAVRDGGIVIEKIPSNPTETHLPVLEGAREIGVSDASVFNHASTHGLNAIITRRLPKVGFITSEGHRDILDIGTVIRPYEHLTNLSWRRSFGDAGRPLVPRYLRRGVRERIAPDGTVAYPLDEDHVREQLRVLKRCDVQGVAVCLLSAYANGEHEQRIRSLVFEELGEVPVSLSSEVSPLAIEYPRASTTVIDVIMKLTYEAYTQRLEAGLNELGFDGGLNYGDSSGSLIAADFAMEQPYRVLFSGPAGGTAASSYLGEKIGFDNLLCADIGGTSCDISVVTNGKPYLDLSYELEPDLTVNSLTTAITSIGAGGGSVVWVNNVGEVRVGPDSAGANPGPACFGHGGTRPTTTDLALLAGILKPGQFGGGRLKLSVEAAEEAVNSLPVDLELSERVRSAWIVGLNNIVEGIFSVALKHGVDPREYSLMAFGAAGGMILPAVLEQSHVGRVIIPPYPGHFSALGLLSGSPVYTDSKTVYTALVPSSAGAIESILDELTSKLKERVPADAGAMRITRAFDARLYGQTAATPFIEIPDGPVTEETIPELVERFHDTYQVRNGNAFRNVPIEVVTFRVKIELEAQKLNFPELPERSGAPLEPREFTTLRYLYEEDLEVPNYEREDLLAGDVIVGPAIVREAVSTTFVTPGEALTVGRHGEMVITLTADAGV